MDEKTKESCNAATVTINGRGPIRIEGSFELVDPNGVKVSITDSMVKICGCGKSQTMPICDGAHKR